MRVRVDKSHPNGYTTAKSEPIITAECCYDSNTCRCVPEHSSAGDKRVAFGGDR